MFRGILFLAFVTLVLSTSLIDDLRASFIKFQNDYGRTYQTTAEFDNRFHIFKQNMKRNEELMKMNPRATFGVNQFSDLSQEEFASRYLMKVNSADYVRPSLFDNSTAGPKNARRFGIDPNNWNWANQGATTGIYNQGGCGSCWAFSATETIESYWFMSGNPLAQFSMEQIVDCDTGDDGCNGGWPSRAYSYVQGAPGIEPYGDYPYTAENGNSGQCQFNRGEAVVTVQNIYTVSGETGIYQQLSNSNGCCYHGGPVSVCVDASTWSGYTGGILTSCPNNVDHCVQAVGYANYGQGGSYWIVRNSWGSSWGENGYIFIEIGQDLCAIGDYATVVSVIAI